MSLFRSPPGQPRIYGHRGARGVWPENTMAGFAYLRDLGIGGVEIDVQLSADGVPVVIHDPRIPMQIARDARGAWLDAPGPRIMELTTAELMRFDMGRLNPAHPYGARFPEQQPVDGARIPRLSEFLDWAAQDPQMVLNIEIKSFAPRADLSAPPHALAEAVAHALSHQRSPNPCLVSSFDWRVLSALRDLAPQIARGYLSHAEPGDDCTIYAGSPWMDGLDLADHGQSLPRLIAAQGAQAWCPWFGDLTSDDLEAAHALGIAVNVWTVNETRDIAAMRAMGVDGVITDYPARCL